MNWKRLIGWSWFVKADKREPMVTGWEEDSFFDESLVIHGSRYGWVWRSAGIAQTVWAEMSKSEMLAVLARRNETIHAEIMRLRRSKKRFTHLLEDQRAVRNERLRIEGGK